MPIKVRLHVYSQRPDPTWVLSDAQASDLFKRVGGLEAPLQEKSPIARLGYRGFSISGIPEPFLKEIHASLSPLDSFQIGSLEEERDIEEWLLETAGNDIDTAVAKHVGESIDRGINFPHDLKAPDASSPCNSAMAQDAPLFSPADWNIDGVRRANNCYNYANDQKLAQASIPGYQNGVAINYCCSIFSGVQPGAVADGLVPTQDISVPLKKDEGWYVALAVWPGQDAHWFRQDSNGCWSHKAGRDFVSMLDDKSQKIVDPKECDRGQYVCFCTYMMTKRGIKISGPDDDDYS